MTMREKLSVFLLASAGLLLASGAARADSCVDLRTGQNWDCVGDPPSGKAPTQASESQATVNLREQLRRRLADKANAPVAPGKLALAQQLMDASARADNAQRSASLTSDPVEKAQFKKAYEAATADLRRVQGQIVDATSDLAQKQALAQQFQAIDADRANAAAGAGLPAGTPAAPVTPQAATAPAVAAPAPDIFSVCEAPTKGVTTCYEIGRSGSACQKVFYQGGQLTWRDSSMSNCSAGDLAQRDAYFAGQPVGGPPPDAPVVDPRSAQLSGLMVGTSAKCQADLRAYLYGSRDSKGSNNAQTAAMKSFAGINADPECKAVLDRLASTAGVEMPQRVLASTARSTWGSAMADAPRATINVPNGQYDVPNGQYTDGPPSNGGWNTGEVISAGTQILSVLGDILGVAAGVAGSYSGGSSYTSQPVSRAPSAPTGTGYVYRRPQQSPSCITSNSGRVC